MYPEVDSITRAVEPYMKLFSTVVKWQRAEKKWMDGAFQELNAETTEAEVQVVVIFSLLPMRLKLKVTYNSIQFNF